MLTKAQDVAGFAQKQQQQQQWPEPGRAVAFTNTEQCGEQLA